jgi:hypothetical protein
LGAFLLSCGPLSRIPDIFPKNNHAYTEPCSNHALTLCANDNDPEKIEALEFNGCSIAILMYNTYLCIWLAARFYSGEVYDAAFTKTILDEQVRSLAAVQAQLQKVNNSGFFDEEGDINYMISVGEVLEMLSIQADALYNYTTNGESSDLQKYDKLRLDV